MDDDIDSLRERGLPIWKTFLSGTVAGGVAESIMFPTEMLSTRLKVVGSTNMSILSTIRQIYKYEGFGAFYRGIDTILWSSLPAKGVYFTAYETVKKLGEKYLSPELQPLVYLVAGMSSELSSSFIYVPFEMVKARMQVGSTWGTAMQTNRCNSRMYPNALYGFRDIFRKEGLRGLYSGYFACIATDCCQSGFQFLFYEEILRLHRYLAKNDKVEPALDLVFGAIAGAMACVMSNPFDMITCRLFIQSGRNDLYKYTGVKDIIKTVYRIEGPRAFFSGLPIKMLQLSPLAGIQYTVYHFISSLLNDDN